MIQQTDNSVCFPITFGQFGEGLLPLLQLRLELEYLHFDTDDAVVLISQHLLNSSHIDVRLLTRRQACRIVEIPRLDLPLHFPVLLLQIPNACLEGTVLFLRLIDGALQVIILVPDEVLSSHVAGQVHTGPEDIVVGVDLLAQLTFVLHTTVEGALALPERLVVLSQQQQWSVAQSFHFRI